MRAAAVAISALLAVCAVPVGIMLVVGPDGHLLSSSTALLVDGLPFASYLLPGLILAGLLGGGALFVLVAQVSHARLAAWATSALGVLVIGWIVVQLAMIHGVSVLHGVTAALGLGLVAIGAEVGGVRRWIAWVAANAAAELIGLGIVAFGLWGVERSGVGAVIGFAAALALGAFEGAVVGLAQAQVLRRWLPGLRAVSWVRMTVYGAMVAWGMGSLPSLFMGGGGGGAAPSETVQMLLAAGLGLVVGPVLAAFQLRELRRHVRGAGVWLVANAVAWAAGMPFVFVAFSILAAGGSLLRGAALLLAAGGLVGAIHGAVLGTLVGRRICSVSGEDIDGAEQRGGRRAAVAGR